MAHGYWVLDGLQHAVRVASKQELEIMRNGASDGKICMYDGFGGTRILGAGRVAVCCTCGVEERTSIYEVGGKQHKQSRGPRQMKQQHH